MKGIYRIYCTVTKDSYIGSTTNLNRRQAEHFDLLSKGNHYNYKLQGDYNKYGKSSFRYEALEECKGRVSRSQLYDKEQVWIDTFKPKYNIQKKSREMKPNLIGLIVSDTMKDIVIKCIRNYTDLEGYIVLSKEDAQKVKSNGGIVVYINDNYITGEITDIPADYIINYTVIDTLSTKVENMLAKYSII